MNLASQYPILPLFAALYMIFIAHAYAQSGSPIQVDFTASDSTGSPPLMIQFFDRSVVENGSIAAWKWRFGDEASSEEQNPQHTYQKVGAYTVSLHITTQAGDTASVSKEEYILLESPGWTGYPILEIDTFMYVENTGVKTILTDLNGHLFRLSSNPQDIHRGDNTYYVPRYGTLTIDISDYIYPEENFVQFITQGDIQDSVFLALGDLLFPGETVDFKLSLKDISEEYNLSQNFPNPFNNSTTIAYEVPARYLFGIDVAIDIYNMLGQRIRRLIRFTHFPGSFNQKWDGRNDAGNLVSSGYYFYRMQMGERYQTGKMLLIR